MVDVRKIPRRPVVKPDQGRGAHVKIALHIERLGGADHAKDQSVRLKEPRMKIVTRCEIIRRDTGLYLNDIADTGINDTIPPRPIAEQVGISSGPSFQTVVSSRPIKYVLCAIADQSVVEMIADPRRGSYSREP